MGKFDGLLLLSDLDGTLLSSDRTISARNRAAVEYFTQNGGLFSIATGRVLDGMRYFLDEVPVNAPAVIFNGAAIYDFAREQAVALHEIGTDGYELTRELLDRFPTLGVEVSRLDGEFVANATALTERHMRHVRVRHFACPPEEIPQPWLKLNLVMEPERIGEVTAYLRTHHEARFFMQHSAPHFFEVLPRGANKGAAARTLCGLLGIKRENLHTVGDGENDVELLSCTENSYCPSNSEQIILKVSKNVLPDNDHDAIAALVALLDQTDRREMK